MLFTDGFNCQSCDWPLDFKEGEARMPRYTASRYVYCHTCYPSGKKVCRGLMVFLNQPAFKKTKKGYDYTLPINDPKCFGCEGDIRVFEGQNALMAKCGHYLCQQCDFKKSNSGILCKNCNLLEGGWDWRTDMLLATFCRTKDVQEYLLKQAAAKTEKGRHPRALKACADCGGGQRVERLFKCHDCNKNVCGYCFYDSHREHSVDKLLGIELDQLEKQHDKRFTENVEGLHGNMKYIQTTIDEAVGKVLHAGKERLSEISKRPKYEEAHDIARVIEKAAEDFEKHCEEYIPVGRKLATRLTELGEELMKDKK